MPARVKLYGTDELKANLRKFGAALSARGRRSVEYHWGRVLRRAQNEFVPEDKSRLRNSGRLEISPKGMSATIVFGGPGIDYAIAVHEHLSVHSPYSWRVAESSGAGVRFKPAGHGPKYLERPVMEELDGRLLKELRDDLAVENLL